MYIAPGLLDRRLTFYERTEGGADGFTRPVYQRTGIYWGRLDATANAFTVAGSPQGHIDSRTTAVATVAEYVAVDPYGIVTQEDDAALYFVRGVYPVRQMRCQQIALEAVDPTSAGEFVLYDPVDVADGVHLLDPAGAFSTAFDEAFG